MCSYRKAFLWSVCALALVACKHDRKKPAKGLPTQAERVERVARLDALERDFASAQRERITQPVEGFVLIPHGVTLHDSEEAARAQGGTLPEARSVADFPVPFDLSAYEVVADKGDVVEVRFLSATELVFHCVDKPVHPLLSRMQLTAWVHKLSLVPVLADMFIQQHEDKSAYGFLPGAPAWPARQTPGVTHVLDAQGFQAAVAGSQAQPLDLAMSYPAPRPPANLRDELLSLPMDVVLWIGREPLMRVAELSPLMKRVVQQREHDSQTMMVALGDSCMQVAALVPRSDATRASREKLSPVMMLSGTGSLVPSRARSGAEHTLYWPDGREAGKLLNRNTSLPGIEDKEASARSGMRCVKVPLDLSEPLCLRTEREESL